MPFNSPKKVHVDVVLLNDYTSGTPNLAATVQLGRKDGWKNIGSGVGREVSVLSMSLEGVLKYKGIRCVMRVFSSTSASLSRRYSGVVSKYPLLSASASAATFFVISFSTVALLLAPAVFWQHQREDTDTVKTEVPAPSPTGEKPRRRSSLKRSTSRGANTVCCEFGCSFCTDLTGYTYRISRMSPKTPRCLRRAHLRHLYDGAVQGYPIEETKNEERGVVMVLRYIQLHSLMCILCFVM